MTGDPDGAQAARVLLSSSPTANVSIDANSRLSLQNVELPLCGLRVSTKQEGAVAFEGIRLLDRRADYVLDGAMQRQQQHTVHGRYMTCLRQDSWDACHTHCGGAEPSGPLGEFKAGCRCGPVEPGCWTNVSCKNPNWLPQPDCGASVSSYFSGGEARLDTTAATEQDCAKNHNSSWDRNRYGHTGNSPNYDSNFMKHCSIAVEVTIRLPQGSGTTTSLQCAAFFQDAKWTDGCNSTTVTGKYDWCSRHDPCPWDVDTELCTDHCLVYGWIEPQYSAQSSEVTTGPMVPGPTDSAADSAAGFSPRCVNDAFQIAFGNVTTVISTSSQSRSRFVDISVPFFEYGHVRGDSANGFSLDLTYSGTTHPWLDLGAAVRVNGSTSSVEGEGHEVTQVSTDNFVVPASSSLHLRKLALYVPSLATRACSGKVSSYPRTDRFQGQFCSTAHAIIAAEQGLAAADSFCQKKSGCKMQTAGTSSSSSSSSSSASSSTVVQFLRVDGTLTLSEVAIPSSFFTTSVSSIFQRWGSGTIDFIDARLYREVNFKLQNSCALLGSSSHQGLVPTRQSPSYVEVESELCPPRLNLTLATLSGNSRADAGMAFTLDEPHLKAAGIGTASPQKAVYRLQDDGRLKVDPPNFVPAGFGFFAPARPGRDPQANPPPGGTAGYGGCKVTDNGRCVSQSFGFLTDLAVNWDGNGSPNRYKTICTSRLHGNLLAGRRCKGWAGSRTTGNWSRFNQQDCATSWKTIAAEQSPAVADAWCQRTSSDGCNFTVVTGADSNVMYSTCSHSGADTVGLVGGTGHWQSTGGTYTSSQWDSKLEWSTAGSDSTSGRCNGRVSPDSCGYQYRDTYPYGVGCNDCASTWNSKATAQGVAAADAWCQERSDVREASDDPKKPPSACRFNPSQPGPRSWQPSPVRPDRWIAKPGWPVDSVARWPGGVADIGYGEAYVGQLGCNISANQQCKMPGSQLRCSEWTCNNSRYGTERCGVLEQKCNLGDYSPFAANCSRPRNLTHGMSITGADDDGHLDCAEAICDCAAVGACIPGSEPPGCFADDANCRRLDYTEAVCAEAVVEYETVCSAVAPGGGVIMGTEFLEAYVNKSVELYKIHGDNHSAPFTRNSSSSDSEAAFWTDTKGSSWRLWNQTLLANSVRLIGSAPQLSAATAFGPSLPLGSPAGQHMLPGQTQIQWAPNFGYATAETFRIFPWKICF